MVSSLYRLVDVIRCVSAWRPISFRAGGQMDVVHLFPLTVMLTNVGKTTTDNLRPKFDKGDL